MMIRTCLCTTVLVAAAMAAPAVVVAAMAAPAVAAPVVAAPASSRPWLDVALPPAPASGAATAKLELSLADNKMVPSNYAGFRISVGGGAPKLVPTGQRTELVVAANARQPLRFEVGGARVLAHVQAGDTLAIHEGHDGGWVAVIGNRMNENAPKRLTVCAGKSDECPTGYLSTLVHEGDPVCRVRAGDERSYKCVKAPVVRARGPLTGRAEVTNASENGDLEELDTVSLAPRPLAGKALGPPISVAIGSESMPWVRLGDAQALLVVAPGQSYQVWLDDQGRVDSARVP